MSILENLVSWGPSGLIVAALLDGAGVPVPGGVDVLITYLAYRRPEDVYWLAATCTLGSVLGNFVLFLVVRRGGKAYLEKRAASPRTQRFRRWFDRYGLLTVFISALVPLPIMPMKIFVLCSGALGASPAAFVATFLGARIPRYFGLALLGRSMGSNAIEYVKSHAWHLTLFALVLFILLALLVKLADRTPHAVGPDESR